MVKNHALIFRGNLLGNITYPFGLKVLLGDLILNRATSQGRNTLKAGKLFQIFQRPLVWPPLENASVEADLLNVWRQFGQLSALAAVQVVPELLLLLDARRGPDRVGFEWGAGFVLFVHGRSIVEGV